MNAKSKPAAQTPARSTPVNGGDGAPLVSLEAAIFKDVRVDLTVKLGGVTMTVDDLLSMKAGAVLTLDRQLSEPVEIYLNEAFVARGEIVAVDDNFGVRVVEVATA